MPIVGENDNVYIEYRIPEHIKVLITDDFLKEFRNQLFRIHQYYSIDTFAEDGIPFNTSTSGWYAAFGKACLLTNKTEIFNYWRTLPWYDSDLFDGELADMLIDRHLILGYISKVIEEQLGIKYDDLIYCEDCGRLYTKDMVVKINEEESYASGYRCLFCQDLLETKDGNIHATDYYRSVLDELDKYKKEHPLNTEE